MYTDAMKRWLNYNCLQRQANFQKETAELASQAMALHNFVFLASLEGHMIKILDLMDLAG